MLALIAFVKCSSHAEQAARLGLQWSMVGCSTAGLRALVREGRWVPVGVKTEVAATLHTCLLGRSCCELCCLCYCVSVSTGFSLQE